MTSTSVPGDNATWEEHLAYAARQVAADRERLDRKVCPKCESPHVTIQLDPRQAGAPVSPDGPERWFNVRCPDCQLCADYVLNPEAL